MKYSSPKFMYVTGSIKGVVDQAVDPSSSKKYSYIKIKRDEYLLGYIGKNGRVVDVSEAIDFSHEQALTIRYKIQSSPKAKNLTVELFETTKKLNNGKIQKDHIERKKEILLQKLGLNMQNLTLYQEQCASRDKQKNELLEKSEHNKIVAMFILAALGLIIGIILAVCISFSYFFIPIAVAAIPIFILIKTFDYINPQLQQELDKLDSIVDKDLEEKVKKYYTAVKSISNKVKR